MDERELDYVIIKLKKISSTESRREILNLELIQSYTSVKVNSTFCFNNIL